MRQLNFLELNSNMINGAGTITYAPALPGYEIIGWEETFLYWDTTEVIQDSADGFTTTVHTTKTPIYDIAPVYVPID